MLHQVVATFLSIDFGVVTCDVLNEFFQNTLFNTFPKFSLILFVAIII